MSVDVSNQVEDRSYPRRGLHAADARAATRDIMRSWHVTGEPADDVTLVVSELIGNAVRHAFGPVVILTLTLIRLRPEIAHPSTCTY